jgi:uncharacterized protein (TIGR00369 family)
MLNPAHCKGVAALVNQSPFFIWLSMTIEEMGTGYSLLKIELNPQHMSLFGAIQGGVYSAMIDAAAYWACYSELDETAGLITMDVMVHHLTSIKEGTLWGRGRRIKIGRTTCLADVEICSQDGTPMA